MSKISVNLSILGKQNYVGQDPDSVELLTDGYMEHSGEIWTITYEESDLTGLQGVTTTFRVEPKGITLSRTGKLQSQMIFQEGVRHESLYQLEFGALLICVCARQIRHSLTEEAGGQVDLVYSIEIEDSAAGTVEYHLEVTPKKETQKS